MRGAGVGAALGSIVRRRPCPLTTAQLNSGVSPPHGFPYDRPLLTSARRVTCCRLLLLGALSLAGCRRLWDAEVRPALAAPGGAHVAQLYELVGGLGGGYRDALLSVRPRGARLDPYGDSFTFGVTRAERVELRWLGPDTLQVTYPADADVFRRCARAGSVALRYAAGPPRGGQGGDVAPPRADVTRGCA